MDLDPARLRPGELAAGTGAALLLAFMFLLPWYGLEPVIGRTAQTLGLATSFDGWDSLAHVRWLLLVTIAAALALVYLQAACRAPAVPSTFSVIVTVLGLLSVLALIYRVLINVPGADDLVEQKLGAYVGLLASIVILYGGYRSMREEGTLDRDGPQEIETVRLGEPASS